MPPNLGFHCVTDSDWSDKLKIAISIKNALRVLFEHICWLMLKKSDLFSYCFYNTCVYLYFFKLFSHYFYLLNKDNIYQCKYL
jgi:hypothetical protein